MFHEQTALANNFQGSKHFLLENRKICEKSYLWLVSELEKIFGLKGVQQINAELER